jgi:hypothetical protein
VEIASRIDIRPQIQRNLGNVIGVQTQAIHGDVYGNDVYQVEVYVLNEAGREGSWRRFLTENTPPYKFLAPYTARDRSLFKGRDREVRQVVGRVGEQRVVVLYGQTGVGKTSLLAAGVIPQLLQFGALVVNVQDYLQPVETMQAALAASSEQLSFALPDGRDMTGLVQALESETRGTLVLVLDHFERLFEPSVEAEQRTSFINGLVESLRCTQPENLRVVLALEENSLGQLAELREHLPDVLESPIRLLSLSRQQAKEAIWGPLQELDSRVSPVGDLVDACLLPDLDDLTPQQPGYIHPPHLQVICHTLYEAARGRYPPHINENLYIGEAKGADGIMARYMEETLHVRLGEDRGIAEKVLSSMASPGSGRWVVPEQLPTNGASPGRLRDVLERLVGTGLLLGRISDGVRRYGFSSQTVADEVRRMSGPDVERRHQAGDELERIWSAWLARDALATRGQLRYLAQTGAHLEPQPVKALLLLRSAVARYESTDLWLSWLRDESGKALISQLEEPDAVDVSTRFSRATQGKAELLLGVRDVSRSDWDASGTARAEAVSRSAAGSGDPVTRQTAALALTVPYGAGAVKRIEEAVQAGLPGRERRRRRAELRGALSDSLPEIAKLNSELPPLDRLSVWLWRVRRRLFRERRRLASLTLGAALGAGLGLGIVRAVVASLAGAQAGVELAMGHYLGGLLGGVLTLGLLLAELLLFGEPSERSGGDASGHERPRPRRQSAGLAIGLGTLFFGTVHLLIAWLMGLSGRGTSPARPVLVVATGFVAGLGLSLALYGQPRLGWRMGAGQWLLRLAAAVVAFAGMQAAFIVAGYPGATISFLRSKEFYGSHFAIWDRSFRKALGGPYPLWIDALALLDGAVVAIVLTLTMTAGLVLAARWLARYQSLAARAGE